MGSLSLNSRLTAIKKKHFCHCRCIWWRGGLTYLWNGLLGEEFVNILPERNVWRGAVHTYCSFSSGKTKRKNKFYQKRYIFLHCIENWNFFPFGMKYLLFWEKGKKAIEKEADGCCCLCSTPRLLHHLARMWGTQIQFLSFAWEYLWIY